MLEIERYSQKFSKEKDGIWRAIIKSSISYPDNGNKECFQLEDRSFWFIQRNKIILNVLRRFLPEEPFFDIGGGNGFVTKGIQDIGVEAVLVEPGQEGVINAKVRGIDNILCCDFNENTFLPNSIPSIGLFDVIEHIEDDIKFLENAYKCLKPSGRLYITVPAYTFLWSKEDNIAQHYRRYTLSQLEEVVGKAGFKLIFKSYFFAYLMLPIFLLRALPYRLGFTFKESVNKGENDHVIEGCFTRQVIYSLFKLELFFIKILGALPFGASCIIVAEK